MAAAGFGAGAQQWVSLLHAGTTVRVAFNGWHTTRFSVQSGIFQGSSLSPLLFVLAVQPMAAHARQLAAQQGLHALSMPAGEPAPLVHCHADDTTIHAASPANAAAILTGSISLHCQATGPGCRQQSPPAWASAPCSTWRAQMQPPASHSVQQNQPPHTWASPSAQTLTQRLAACIQTFQPLGCRTTV